jgi:rare lipoprotein A
MRVSVQRLCLAVLLISVYAGCFLFGATNAPATQIGTAVYYSDKMDGKPVKMKGEKYDRNALTAATHRRYPLGSMLHVTNLSNNKAVTVKVNDRMNPRAKPVIDLSRKAAEELDMIERGHVKVKIELLPAK